MIVSIPNPVLVNPAKTVIKIDKKVKKIIKKLKKDLENAKNPKGVGLAAPQIGVSLQIFAAKPDSNSDISIFINPEIIWKSENLTEIKRPRKSKKNTKSEKKLEGCLSIPNIWGYLKRSDKVRLKYMSEDGQLHEEEFSDFMATIIQHETDHLKGVLFTQRVLEQNQKLYSIEQDKKGEDELIEVEI